VHDGLAPQQLHRLQDTKAKHVNDHKIMMKIVLLQLLSRCCLDGVATLLRLYGSPNRVDVLFQSASVYVAVPLIGGSVNLPLLTAAASRESSDHTEGPWLNMPSTQHIGYLQHWR